VRHFTVGTDEVCASDGLSGSAYGWAHRDTNERPRRADFARYGVPWADHGRYEDDRLFPLCLGDAEVQASRWRQPRWGPWNSYEKDRLESYACKMSARAGSD
jgi:hypothetical protein